MRLLPLLILLVVTLAAPGCEFVGPRAIRSGQNAYNESLKTTRQEEMLLNIVRLRHTDDPYFLKIASITATTEAGVNVGADEMDRGVFGGVSYSERPNITYTPLTGEEFVLSLLTHIDLNTIYLLNSAGWELDDILRVFANRMNGVENAPTGAGTTPEGTPRYERFQTIVSAIDQLEDQGALIIAPRAGDEANELVITILPDARQTEELDQFYGLLNLDPELGQYRVRIGYRSAGPDEIVIETRSIMAAMYYLARAVEVPEEYRLEDRIYEHVDDAGEPFDWLAVHKDLFRVRTATRRPSDAYAAVEYKGSWYYIDGGDIEARETLTMVNMVFTLQAGGEPGGGPLITIPVG